MKATINGITVEGTPQEIMEYQQIQASKAMDEWKKQIGTGYDPRQWLPKVTSDTIKRCDHPCNCSGACEGKISNGTTLFSNPSVFRQTIDEIGKTRQNVSL